MSKCRATACSCEAGGTEGCPLYCAMCQEYTPICPVCGAVYGEHRLDCTVADGYVDCGEGPFDTRAEATTFATIECGYPWDVVKGMSGRWYVLLKTEDES